MCVLSLRLAMRAGQVLHHEQSVLAVLRPCAAGRLQAETDVRRSRTAVPPAVYDCDT